MNKELDEKSIPISQLILNATDFVLKLLLLRRDPIKEFKYSKNQGTLQQLIFVDEEVILYRSVLVTAVASFVLASSTALLSNDSAVSNLIERNLDLFYAIGSCALGLSLFLNHIYVTEIKRTLQALWLLGVLGSLATYSTLAQPACNNLAQYVIENPTAVWFARPLFAALTGLVFKEGLCCGKLEAGILTFGIPSVLLGHLVNSRMGKNTMWM